MAGAWSDPSASPLPVEMPVFGQYNSRCYGIPLMMDILDRHNLRATFFTEVFCSYVLGEDAVAKVLNCIRDRGHDAQLHLHPTYRFYHAYQNGRGPRRLVDLIYQLPEDEQRELIADGIRLFRELSGCSPVAYRAGCYGASELTLAALKENGIRIDSSYNLAYLGSSCGFSTPGLNSPRMIEGVYELPVTVFRVPGTAGYKPLEISAVSVSEIVKTLEVLSKAGCSDAVLVLHSFSFLKNHGRDFKTSRPDRIVIRRFEALCAALVEMGETVLVTPLSELDFSNTTLQESDVIPSVNWRQAGVRKLIQAINRSPWL